MYDEEEPQPLPWKAIVVGVSLFVVVCLGTAGVMLGVRARQPRVTEPNCVVAGTLVSTPSGQQPVEALTAGDAIWCRAPSGERVAGRVTWTRGAPASSHVKLGFDDGSLLQVTAEHPLSTPGGWVPAGDLAVGDAVDGEAGALRLISVDVLSRSVTVCDLSVTPHANFFAAGVLVHNKSPMPPPSVLLAEAKEEAAVDVLMTLGASGLTAPAESPEGPASHTFGGETWTRTESIDGPVYVTDEIDGYLFELHFSDGSPEGPRWCVTARPSATAGYVGDSFILNQDGVIYTCPNYQPVDLFKHRADCSIPPELLPSR